MSVQDRYDNGDKDSPYFVNLNEGKVICTTTEYCDCKGETFCVTTEEPAPYLQGREILAPLFVSTTLGAISYKRSEILEVYLEKSKTFVILKSPMKVGDILKESGATNPRYFLKSKVKQIPPRGGRAYEIQRIDGSKMLKADGYILKPKVTLVLTGRYNDVTEFPKCCN